MNRAGPDVERTIEQALQAAATAPSLFNSQPWRIRTVGNTVLICTDRSRARAGARGRDGPHRV